MKISSKVIGVHDYLTRVVGFILTKYMSWLIDWDEMIYMNQAIIAWFIFFGFLSSLVFIFCYFRRWRGLSRASKKIVRALEDPDELEARREDLFSPSCWANKPFKNYVRAWKSACPTGEKKAAFPVLLTDYLSTQRVIESCCYHKLALALPGIFVSLGILGTFFGVMCGIGNINPGNIERLSQEIFGLIAGLKVAFLTSLIGICFSVFFTLVHRLLVESISRGYARLNDLCAQHLCPYETEEASSRLVLEQFDEVNQSMKTMATDLATQLSDSLGPAIGSALGEHVVPAIQTMVDGMGENALQVTVHNEKVANLIEESIGGLGGILTQHLDETQKRQTEAMDGVLKEYVENMNLTFKNLFEEMGSVVRETMQVQKDIQEGMTDFSRFVRDNFDKQEDLIESTTQAANVMANTIGQFESITASVESTAKSLEHTGDVVDRAAGKTKEIYGAVESAAEVAVDRVNAMQVSMDETWETMSKRTEDLLNGMESLFSGQVTRFHESLEKTIGELGRTINESASGMAEAWESIHQHADDLVTTLDGTTREFSENIGGSLTRGLEIFDQKVAEVVERFSGTLYETKESINLLSPTLEKLNQGISGMQAEMGTQKEVLERMIEISEMSVVPSVEKSYEAAKMLSEGTVAISHACKELTGWAEAQEGFVQNLQAAIEDEKKEHVVALGGMLERFAGEINLALKKSTVVDEQILETMHQMTSGDRNIVHHLEIQGGHLKGLDTKIENWGSKGEKALGGYLSRIEETHKEMNAHGSRLEESFTTFADLLEKSVTDGENRSRFSLFGGSK